MGKLLSVIIGLLLAFGIYLNIGGVLTAFYILLALLGTLFIVALFCLKYLKEPVDLSKLTPTTILLGIINQAAYIYVALVTNNNTLLYWYVAFVILTYTTIYKMKSHNKKFNSLGK